MGRCRATTQSRAHSRSSQLFGASLNSTHLRQSTLPKHADSAVLVFDRCPQDRQLLVDVAWLQGVVGLADEHAVQTVLVLL